MTDLLNVIVFVFLGIPTLALCVLFCTEARRLQDESEPKGKHE